MGANRVKHGFVGFALLLLLAGCSRPWGARALDAREYERLTPLIGARLRPWLVAWTTVAPGLELRQFKKAYESSIRDVVFPIDTVLDGRRDRLYVFSPDKRRFVDPYGGLVLFEEQGQLKAGLDVDSWVTVFEVKTSTARRIAFCGTPCGFQDAAWLSNDLLIVAGVSEEPACIAGPAPCRWAPAFWVFDLVRNTSTVYVGPSVQDPPDDYVRRRVQEKLPNVSFE